MPNKSFALFTSVLLGGMLGALLLTSIMSTSTQAGVIDTNISIVKEPDQMIISGSTATFTILISNTSGVTLTSVIVTDTLVSACDRVVGELEIDGTFSYTCSLAGVMVDFTNVVTVTAVLSNSELPAFALDTAIVDAINPAIAIAKTPDTQTAVSGLTVTFTIAVTNTGDATLSNVTVLDALASDCDRALPSLNPTQSTSYDCNADDVTADFTNSATALGTPPVGDVVSDTDTAFVNVISPAIAITKAPDEQMAVNSSTVTFTIAFTNTGDVPLTNVAVSDPLAPDCNHSLPGTLVTGGSVRYTCSLDGVTSDLTNMATASGIFLSSGIVSDTDTALVNVINPDVAIAKTPDLQVVDSGATITFTVAVTNTGDVALSNVTVLDTLAPNCDFGPVNLNAGQSRRYTCHVQNVITDLTNVVTVIGTPPTGGVVSAADSAQVILGEAPACPADMIAYWKLDETSGPTYDDFNNDYVGVCDGPCPSPAAGIINGGQAFNGNDTGISVPPVPEGALFDWGATDSFSIEFWMRTDKPDACSGENQVIIGRDDSNTDLHWWVGCWKSGEAGFVLIDRDGNGGDQSQFLQGTTDLASNDDWHHIVATRDAHTGENRLFVDGTEEASVSVTYLDSFASQSAALNIGWIQLSDVFHFAGTVDEVALYNRSLPATEVWQHYYEGLLTGRWYCEASAFAPKIASTPVTMVVYQRSYTYDVDAIGNPAPTYALTTKPAGMTIDPTTGLINWQPDVSQQGSHSVQVEARNLAGVDRQSFTIKVTEEQLCPADMISYWKLDETSGDIYADSYDGNDGACVVGQCPSPTTGQVNGARAFDGARTQINVPADAAFDWGATDSFSIEFWMRTDKASTCVENQVVLGRDDSSTELHWWTGCKDGGWAAFYLIDKDGTLAAIIGTTDLTDGFWHHVASIRDASAEEIRIYVDGQEENTAPASYSSGFDSQTAALNIGWLNLSSGFHFAGSIDEISVYSRALSAAEIQQHNDRGLFGRGYCIIPAQEFLYQAYLPIILNNR